MPRPTHLASAAALLVGLAAAAAAQPADPLGPFRPLPGDWAGTLTYTDYQDDATRVEMGVWIAVAEARDSLGAPALRFAYAYTEPDGRAVEGAADLLVPDADPGRVRFGGSEWAVAERDTSGGRLRLVLVQEGEDNDRPATIRETLTAGPDGWTLLKEVRYAGAAAFFERHTYALRRAGPPAGAARIPGAALQADVAVLRRAFEALHPGLYRYHTPDEMAALFEALHADVSGGLSLPETYLTLAAFLNRVRCGHTFPNPENQPAAVADAVLTASRRLPFAFRWIGRRMVVTRALSAGGHLQPGTEVLAVDGVPAGAVLARLLPLSRADGGNDAKRVANLEVRGLDRYEAFDVYYPLVFPLGAEAVLTVRGPLGAPERTVRVATMTHAERTAVRSADAAAQEAASSAGWTFAALDDSTAVLRMPSWVTYHEAWDWRAFVDSTFDALVERGTSLLVVDLRGNEGGTSVGDALLSRLVERDLPTAALVRWVRYRRAPADLLPALDTWDRSFDDWSAHTTAEAHGGLYRMTRYDDGPEGSVVHPSGRRFTGRVAVLVDAHNSSATFEFARAVQENGLGVLVGQPTGGNRRGINGGAFYFLRLPNSGVEVDLPLVGFFPPDGAERPDAGLQPDVLVEPRADDLARGVDAELEAARRLAR